MKENNKFMFLQNIDYFLQIVFMLILFSMLILQILNRFFISVRASWTLEIITLTFAAMVWFGIGIGVKEYTHIGITILLKNTSKKVQKIVVISHLVLFMLLILLIMYFSSRQLIYYFEKDSRLPASGFPYWMARSPIILGGVCTVYRITEKIYRISRDEDKQYQVIFSDSFSEDVS